MKRDELLNELERAVDKHFESYGEPTGLYVSVFSVSPAPDGDGEAVNLSGKQMGVSAEHAIAGVLAHVCEIYGKMGLVMKLAEALKNVAPEVAGIAVVPRGAIGPIGDDKPVGAQLPPQSPPHSVN